MTAPHTRTTSPRRTRQIHPLHSVLLPTAGHTLDDWPCPAYSYLTHHTLYGICEVANMGIRLKRNLTRPSCNCSSVKSCTDMPLTSGITG